MVERALTAEQQKLVDGLIPADNDILKHLKFDPRTASRKQCKRQAKWIRCVAEGGYLDGTHDYDDMQRMRAEADALKAYAKTLPKDGTTP